MGRELVKETDFKFQNNVKSFMDFTLFCDEKNGFQINPLIKPKLIEKANDLLSKTYPVLSLSEYMSFKLTGNRNVFEEKYFERREDLFDLILAELSEKKGRFLSRIIDLLWIILEETTWVIPAHYDQIYKDAKMPIAWKYKHKNTPNKEPIDLFSAVTAVTVACTYYFFHNEFDRIDENINVRILEELQWRIWDALKDDGFCYKMGWTGVNGYVTCNWCPWIVQNLLLTCAFSVRDIKEREYYVQKLALFLDSFTRGYEKDGACNEGPVYWNVAVGALFNAFEILYDLTDGKLDFFKDDLLKNMGEFIEKLHIGNFCYLSYSDSSPEIHFQPYQFYRYGKRTGSHSLMDFGVELLLAENRNGNALQDETGFIYFSKDNVSQTWKLYNSLREISAPSIEGGAKSINDRKNVYIESLQMFIQRQTKNGLYLAVKGGNNGEMHNHNDVGNMVVFSGIKPIFIDVGSGVYTKKTFDENRYTLWNNISSGHNLPTVNSAEQCVGEEYSAKACVYDKDKRSFSLQLENAYPKSSRLQSYCRTVQFKDEEIIISEDMLLAVESKIDFHYICVEKPTLLDKNKIKIFDTVITFDEELSYALEELDCEQEEYKDFPQKWKTEKLYRIVLTQNDVKQKKWTVRIKKED